MKSAYSISDRLRAAGFVASIQADNEDKKDFKWIIEVNDKITRILLFITN